MFDTDGHVDPNHPLLNVASHIVQVTLTHTTNQLRNYMGTLTVWKKRGGRFGFSDELLWFCPTHGCLGMFESSFTLSEDEAHRLDGKEDIRDWPEDLRQKYINWNTSQVSCTQCGNITTRDQLADSYFFNNTVDKVAVTVSRMWDKLEGDADVLIVRNKQAGMFAAAKQELYDPMRGSLDKYTKMLEQARDREMALYTMVQINKDSRTKSTTKCIEGFLRS